MGRAALAAAAVAASLLVAGCGTSVDVTDEQGPGASSGHQSPNGAAPAGHWAVASGTEVQLGTGPVVQLGAPVSYLYQTSAGVLVNFGPAKQTWGGSPSWALVEFDGAVERFKLDLGEEAPGTDPSEPYLAFVEATESPTEWEVVVRDLTSAANEARYRVEGSFTWVDRPGLPNAEVDGTTVYVSLDNRVATIDLTTGQVSTEDGLAAATPSTVSGGRTIVSTWAETFPYLTEEVVDVATGDVLLELDQEDRSLDLSPDGRHALAKPTRFCEQDSDGHETCEVKVATAILYDLATGEHLEIDVSDARTTWTPSGDLLRVTDSSVDVCDADTAACESTPLKIDNLNLVLTDAFYW